MQITSSIMPTVEYILQQLSELEGLQGCALVDPETGMSWHHAGRLSDIEQIGEAAIEFWRAQRRMPARFKEFGAFYTSAHWFEKTVIVLLPCSVTPELVLVCVGEKDKVNLDSLRLPLAAIERVLLANNTAHDEGKNLAN